MCKGADGLAEIDDRWLLVGHFLTNRSIDFQAKQNKFATLWQPGRVDIERVIKGSPWTFNRAPLIFEWVKHGENPRNIPLLKLELWVQLHNMTVGFMSERVIQGVGNYIGAFVKSDPNNFSGVWRDYLLPKEQLVHEYSLDLKAAPRRRNYADGSRWLRSGLAVKNRTDDRSEASSSRDGRRSDQGAPVTGRQRTMIAENWGPPLLHPDSRVTNEEPAMRRVDNINGGAINKDQSLILGRENEKVIQGLAELDLNIGLTFIDNKRRRMGLEKDVGFNEIQHLELGHEISIPNEGVHNMDISNLEDNVNGAQYENSKNLMEALDFDGVFVVDANGASGGIAMLWKNNDSGTLLGYSKNHIDLQVSISPTSPTWRLTGVYGEPNRNRRSDSWTLLRSLKDRSPLPWCVIEDINNIVRQEDKRGERPYPQWLLTGFQQNLLHCGLDDLELQGHQYTWEKGRETNAWIEVCLDRTLVSTTWNQLFQSASLSNMGFATSDHSPLFLEPIVVNNFTPSRRFRFENSWLKEPFCFEIVCDVWSQEQHISISSKIKICAEKLSVWGKELIGTLNHCIKSYKADLKKLHGLRDTVFVQRYAEIKKKLYDAFDQRESFWKQRAKQFWLKEGDHNSSYFHEVASSRKKKQSAYPTERYTSVVTDLMNSELCQPVEEEEVRKVVFQMYLDKNGFLADGCGDANVVLIPKKRNLERMPDLHPIALCNVLFKIITKVVEAKGKEGFMALKLDMSKAYNLIEWDFLEAMLRKLGFVENWIKLIMKCVKSAKYCVTHGNNEVGPILPTRVANGAPRVSHMLFADDSYLYCKATKAEARQIQEVLSKFEFASGQKVNFSKSSIFFSANTLSSMKDRINSILGMTTADENSLYLGLPSSMGRNKSVALGFLKNKVKNRLGYGTKFLSRAGKEILIKTVAQALPSYAMSVFLIPQEVIKDMEGLMSKFWWQSSSNSPKGWRFLTQLETLVSKIFKASVLEARQLVIKGVRWTVGDGTSISVLGEPWLPDAQDPFHSHGQEKLTWIGEVSGLFIVKSAYKMIQEMIGENTQDTAALEAYWKKFWALKLPSKMKNLFAIVMRRPFNMLLWSVQPLNSAGIEKA
ncbi:uncharacterized protein LOC133034161 [Cannabis sativa]|uniref:uncharacterized protein LOC133034161 n=1 Tax=Cannabis sativa TaxID=3483 RepID=UPI0029CA5E12|nr:uncharacterized protein LOC133034161 [Cannabis sativa]